MSLQFIFEHGRAAVGGLVLGAITAFWLHAVWSRWHPQTIRFWGAWYTDPRLLVLLGIMIGAAWVLLFMTS